MKIIAIEGSGEAEKYIACELLKIRLESEGYKIAISNFRHDDQPIGNLILNWGKKEWKASRKTIELIMTADMQHTQDWFNELENQNYDFLILDSYTLSQFIYAKTDGIEMDWIIQLQKHLRKPDLDIIIDIPAEICMSRKNKKNIDKKRDYNSELEYRKYIRDDFILLSEKYSSPIHRIVDGKRTIEEMHEEIYEIVTDHLT
ncbi:hypothetical protein [Paenibacillus sp. HB172176]|uniref:dTMP kinase n=1 Tax=Paenibacillus sp. HB172176 TaxID=2493690 RepID=UPI001438F4AB|nr:hypothetical protein [Paenibacillus sp. HB172176]